MIVDAEIPAFLRRTEKVKPLPERIVEPKWIEKPQTVNPKPVSR